MADYTVSNATTTVDGNGNYNFLVPGDRLLIPNTRTAAIRFRNIAGTPDFPITIINTGGQVTLTGASAFYSSIHMVDCEHFRLSGTGAAGSTYGFALTGNRRGVMVQGDSADFEIDHVEIYGLTGIQNASGIKLLSTADSSWMCSNVEIHHCYVHDRECGMYLGCNHAAGVPELSNIEVHHNITERTEEYAIGLKMARTGTNSVHHNTIYDAGRVTSGVDFQMGLNIVHRTVADVHHNKITLTKRYGLYFEAGGACDVYDNIISEVNGLSALKWDEGSGCKIYNNTIVDNTCSDGGIRIDNDLTGECYDNIVSESGGIVGGALATIYNNETGNIASQNFRDAASDDYHLTATSPARDAGSATGYAATDYDDMGRPVGSDADIGAYEFLEVAIVVVVVAVVVVVVVT